jgi:hypothetical protein
MFIYTRERKSGNAFHAAIRAHTSVASTSSISIDARRLFFKPNCNGVKAKLNIRFNTNGSATIAGISFVNAL